MANRVTHSRNRGTRFSFIRRKIVQCDPARDANGCSVGGVKLSSPNPVVVPIAASGLILKFAIGDVLPAHPPAAAEVRVRFSGSGELAAIKPGDRDRLFEERAATVQSVVSRGSVVDVTLRLGADPSREGWRYRGQLLVPGAPFRLTTDSYVLSGAIESVSVTQDAASGSGR